MSNYTKTVNFATKDNLSPGNPLKIVKGTEIDTEYNNIATAIATKTDGAASSTDNAIARFDSTTGKIIQNSVVTIDDTTGDIVGTATQGVFNTVSTTVNAFGAATTLNLGAATGTATVNNTTLAAKAITASTTLVVTGTSTLTGSVTATAGVTGPITSSSVAITGGSITGITDLAVTDGGTGASTAAGGLNNLLPSQTSNANKYLQTDGTNASWDAVSLSTADITGTLGVANGGTGVTTSTGTTNVVLSNSPTLVTPILGTPTSATLTNATGLPISTGVSGLGTGVATLLATPSSANLASAITDETGSGALVFATSPTLVTPILGTPTSGTLTNATGLPLTTGVTGQLPVANGGTGTATPSIVAGTNVTVTGPWPNQTIAASGGGGTPGGSTTQVQYNNAGAFGGITGATTDGTALTLVAPVLGTPASATLTNATGLPISTGVSGLGTGIATALAVNTGSAGAPILFNGALGTPTSGTVTNLTGTASININGTIGATTPATGAFTSVRATSLVSTGTSQTAGANQLALVQSGATSILVAYGAGVGSGNRGAYDFYQADSAAGNIQIPLSISSAGAVSALTTFAAGTTIGVGGATPSASGAGITFPASISASTDGNTLDDYEEGSWTPTVGGTSTYTLQTSKYTKIGNFVQVDCAMELTLIGTGSTQYISGLPFGLVSAGASGGTVAVCSGLALNFYSIAAVIGYGTSTQIGFSIQTTLDGATSNGNAAVFQDGVLMYCSATYRVAT